LKAVRTLRYGPAEVMDFVDMPDPEIGPNEILIRVHASSVNPVDWKVRSGALRFVSGWNPPQVLGADFAGEVEETGAGVEGYSVGDKVYGMVPAFKGGAYAEKVVARPKQIAPMPANISFEQAAVLPLVSLTVHQALFDRARQRPHQHVLVNGCTGGLGHIAVQMAKARGFQVTGVCSTGNLPVAKQLGADHVIDYRAQSPLEGKQRYDLVLDAVANLSFRDAKRVLTPDGVYVSSIPSPENILVAPFLNRFRRQKHRFLSVAPNGAALRRITEMVEAGQIKPSIEKVYGLNEIREAHTHSESGRVVGKLALHVAN
jgi:NADPH:quinone reductase-like Zn-dependent oxidoreductase